MMIGLLLAAALGQGGVATAQPARDLQPSTAESSAGVVSYPAEFFAEARPTTAFDMVQRLPGFSFNGGVDVRGFGGAAGNVLIDGERPTSKAVSLEDLLRRLPATSVLRIDLIRGGATGVDMQGQTLVANVVRSRAAAQDLALSAGTRFYGNGWVAPHGDVEWTRRSGPLSLEAAARYALTANDFDGEGTRHRYFPDGALREYGPYATRQHRRAFSANGSAELDLTENLYRVNVGIERDRWLDYDYLGRLAPGGAVRSVLDNVQHGTSESLELGGDYTRLVTDRLSLQVVGLHTRSEERTDETATEGLLVDRFDRRESEGESILRGVATLRPSGSLRVEAGGEVALNHLEARTLISQNGVELALPNANVRVEEERGEAFATAAWKPSDMLSVEAGLRFEASRISQSGDTDLSRSFRFLKPRLLVAYSPDRESQVRLRVEREVDQLRFGDFVASADLNSGEVSAGGVQLEPERAWVFEAAAERRFWGRGAVVLTLAHEEVEKLVDRIPFGGFDAPGNLDSATRDRLNLALTLPLDRLGVPNGLITADATWRRSSVTDPVTGEARSISGENPFSGKVAFSQDVARLRSTWGLDGAFGVTSVTYRINEVRRQSRDSYWTLYWDWKPDPSLSIRAELQNLTRREQRRFRTRFSGPRASGVVNELEYEAYRLEPFAYVRIRKAL